MLLRGGHGNACAQDLLYPAQCVAASAVAGNGAEPVEPIDLRGCFNGGAKRFVADGKIVADLADDLAEIVPRSLAAADAFAARRIALG
jgi:hypothetical protein